MLTYCERLCAGIPCLDFDGIASELKRIDGEGGGGAGPLPGETLAEEGAVVIAEEIEPVSGPQTRPRR